MCEPSPVRKVLSRFTVRQIESALEAAKQRQSIALKAADKASAAIFQSVAEACKDELRERLEVIAARDVMREAQPR